MILQGGCYVTFSDVLIIIFIVVGIIVAGLYFLNKWASKKMREHDDVIDRTKQKATIYVIDKKKDYAKNANFPKTVTDNMPKMGKRMKLYMVQAKIGPQIHTLLTDKDQYEALHPKKNAQVELAGMYIVSVQGQKSSQERKEIEKEKKRKEKEAKKEARM